MIELDEHIMEVLVEECVALVAFGDDLEELEEVFEEVFEEACAMELPLTFERMKPSIEKAPKLELKTLPPHLKHVFLGEDNTLPVIISSSLTFDQENRLVELLKEFKVVIGWTIADIKGISPSTCMHRILLENDAKPSRDPQRRLNPAMMEVVKKEILKLLSVGIIYPISDSEWVSPVHCVPKKAGISLEKNQRGDSSFQKASW